jgi:hypothetical protein
MTQIRQLPIFELWWLPSLTFWESAENAARHTIEQHK